MLLSEVVAAYVTQQTATVVPFRPSSRSRVTAA